MYYRVVFRDGQVFEREPAAVVEKWFAGGALGLTTAYLFTATRLD